MKGSLLDDDACPCYRDSDKCHRRLPLGIFLPCGAMRFRRKPPVARLYRYRADRGQLKQVAWMRRVVLAMRWPGSSPPGTWSTASLRRLALSPPRDAYRFAVRLPDRASGVQLSAARLSSKCACVVMFSIQRTLTVDAWPALSGRPFYGLRGFKRGEAAAARGAWL